MVLGLVASSCLYCIEGFWGWDSWNSSKWSVWVIFIAGFGFDIPADWHFWVFWNSSSSVLVSSKFRIAEIALGSICWAFFCNGSLVWLFVGLPFGVFWNSSSFWYMTFDCSFVIFSCSAGISEIPGGVFFFFLGILMMGFVFHCLFVRVRKVSVVSWFTFLFKVSEALFFFCFGC